MPFKDKQKKYDYDRKNRKYFALTLQRKTEADIIDWLDSQPNKALYIKALIRADMEKEKK